jgi:16S rRNA (adenine1518-N6/adenine1519-N6)-dimethyltransferase
VVPAKSRLGQNFLHDEQAIHRIVAALGDCSDRTVIEIGPGRGAITRGLSNKVGKVIALEFDEALAAQLASEFSGADRNVTVEKIDVLAFDFAAASRASGQKLIVVGNLPYYISSPILTKLAESAGALDRAVLMVQREVAERVTATPGSREYGLLSVAVQLHGPVQQLFTLPPSAFSPPPQVHSTVFRWRFAPRFEELGIERGSFLAFLRRVFALKRKTLANNLRAARFDPETIKKTIENVGIDPMARAEAVSIENLAGLWRSLKREGVIPSSEMTQSLEIEF